MTKISGGLPVKTRLPVNAWIIAGLVTFLSVMSSLMQFIESGGVEKVQQASVTSLLGLLHAL